MHVGFQYYLSSNTVIVDPVKGTSKFWQDDPLRDTIESYRQLSLVKLDVISYMFTSASSQASFCQASFGQAWLNSVITLLAPLLSGF